MALVLKMIISGYLHAERNLIDPRTQDWFLVPNSLIATGIIASYFYIVQVLGPSLMKNRKPFELKNTLIVYNIIQVILSVYICLECGMLYLDGYSFKCQPIEWDESPRAMRAATIIWVYYIVKVVDLLDTVFFVMRKKYNQVSFLHLYHHAGMVALGHIGTKFVPGGQAIFIPFINSAVHAVMYGYYCLTVYAPETKSNIWMKKKVTQIQIMQFLMTAVVLTLPLYHRCGYPAWISFILVPNNVCIFVLFSEFYIRSYWIKPKKEKREESMKVTADQKTQ